MIHVKVLNWPAFERDIGKLGKIGKAPMLEKALDAAAFVAEGRMKVIVRDKNIVDTGALLNSIAVFKAGSLQRAVGPTVEYAAYQEYGTSRGLVARPFAGPTITDHKGELLDAFRHQLEKDIKETVR